MSATDDVVVDLIGADELRTIGTEWNALLARSGGDNVQLRHDWLIACAATYGRAHRPLVLRARVGDRVVGFAPLAVRTLRLRKLLPYRQIVFLGYPVSDFCDFIIEPEHRAEAIDAFVHYLRSRVSWSEMVLQNLPEISPNAELLRAALQRAGMQPAVRRHTHCYYVRIEGRGWDEYVSADTGKEFVRRGVRRRRAMYDEVVWEVEELVPSGLSDDLYAVMARLHDASQERKERGSVYERPEFRELLGRAFDAMAADGAVRIFFLKIDGGHAAYMLGFQHGGVFYWWQTGFDHAYDRFAPSKVLLWNVLKKGFEERRWREFNFMQGRSEYKRHWTPTYYHLLQVRATSGRGLGPIIRVAQRLGARKAAADEEAVAAE
jgi:CelD/BcsL family acetyltransferase involved in cellulose biosynthesis